VERGVNPCPRQSPSQNIWQAIADILFVRQLNRAVNQLQRVVITRPGDGGRWLGWHRDESIRGIAHAKLSNLNINLI
jgi:hypothetical protein